MSGWGTIPDEVGHKYDIGISSPTWGNAGFTIKPGTYQRNQQLIKRQDVVGALQIAIADRDINFWTRVTQSDWSYGTNQTVFGTSTQQVGSFAYSQGIDNHFPGQISLVPQPSVLTSTTSGQVYRGACIAAQSAGGAASAFFAWTTGNYLVSTDINNASPTFSSHTTGGSGAVLDIVSDGTNMFFATTGGGVWTTTAGSPGNLTQYDTGANVYHRLVYDTLAKKLYGILAPSSGAAVHKINSGAGPTTIYDFVTGRLDAIAWIYGTVIWSWNSGDALNSSPGKCYLFQYDGSSTVFEYTSFGDGAQIVGLNRNFGQLWVGLLNEDLFNDTQDPVRGTAAQMFFLDSAGTFNVGTLTDAVVKQESITKSTLSSAQFMFSMNGTPQSPGGSFFIASSGLTWRWDDQAGGISKSFGSTQISVSGTTYNCLITGMVGVAGKLVALVELLNASTGAQVGGAVVQLSGTSTYLTALATGDCQLVGSRMDLGLPYVEKYWYAFEIIMDALPSGASVLAEYSIDDGTTWTSCTNFDTGTTAPYSSVGGTKYVAQIKQVNPHIRYRLTLTGSASSPVIHAVSARFAPSNPDLKMWQFTITCNEQMRLRNNQVASDLTAQDMLTYLMNVAQQSETVTFYDANEPLDPGAVRPAHTVWVAQAGQATVNTSGTYEVFLQEGEIALVLWEVGSV